MSEPWLPWVALRPSPLRRRLLQLAWLVSALTTLVLVYAALQTLAPAAFAGAALALASTAAALHAARGAGRAPDSIGVDADGQIGVRRTGDGAASAAVPVFVSAILVCVESGAGRRLAVWRDALDADGYRRLAVAARWAGRRKPEPKPAADGLD